MRPDLAETRSANFGAEDRRFNWLWLAGHGAPLKLRNSSNQPEQQDAVLEKIKNQRKRRKEKTTALNAPGSISAVGASELIRI